MARKVMVTLTDDLDEKIEADETVTFSLDGTSYEIDLSDANARKMRNVFGKYVEAARKVTAKGRAAENRRTRQSSGGTVTNIRSRDKGVAIREWAKANGKEVSQRGRIPAAIVAEYEAANAS
jgi:hypothetical protein